MKIVIIAPFFKEKNHVGVYRVDRFVRWLSKNSNEIVIVRAGKNSSKKTNGNITEIVVRDRLKIYKENLDTSESSSVKRTPNSLRRKFANLLLIPDSTIIWGMAVVCNREVRRTIQNADFIISSNPPDSIHLINYYFSKKNKVKSIVDMRDGWIDDPQKEFFGTFPFRAKFEEFLERKALLNATKILVTSKVWKKLLLERLPELNGKTSVLTNGYINNYDKVFLNHSIVKNENNIKILHTGRFTLSKTDRKVSLLLQPMFEFLKGINEQIEIILLGELNQEDLNEVNNFKSICKNVTIKHIDNLPRVEMFKMIQECTGLLILSSSLPVIPSKIFEYIPAKKPILSFSFKNSALWEIGESLDNIYNVNLKDYKECKMEIQKFFDLCKKGDTNFDVPIEYSETILSKIFLEQFKTNS